MNEEGERISRLNTRNAQDDETGRVIVFTTSAMKLRSLISAATSSAAMAVRAS